MLTVALVCGHFMRRLHQPAVLGELVGGLFLGPTIFGQLVPDIYIWLFPTTGTASLALDAVIKVGMLFFLFVAGLEVKLAHLQQRGMSVVYTSGFGVLVPFGLGVGAVLFLPELWGLQTTEQGLLLALFIGAALSISALPVIARILIDLNLIQKEIGVVVMTAATLNDLIGWSLFAVILSMIVPSSPDINLWAIVGLVLGFSGLILILGRWLGPAILRWSRLYLVWPTGFIGLITVLMLGAAALAETIGIHAIFGAFLLGVGLGQVFEKEHQAHEVICQFAISFFAPLYFVSIGLTADFAAHFDWLLTLLILLIACLGKIGGASLGAWLGGMKIREALAVGFGMNARGAMEIILASVALEYNLIDQRIFVSLVIMALVTSMLSGPFVQRFVRQDSQLSGAMALIQSQ